MPTATRLLKTTQVLELLALCSGAPAQSYVKYVAKTLKQCLCLCRLPKMQVDIAHVPSGFGIATLAISSFTQLPRKG